jgi:hypothetical protein
MAMNDQLHAMVVLSSGKEAAVYVKQEPMWAQEVSGRCANKEYHRICRDSNPDSPVVPLVE